MRLIIILTHQKFFSVQRKVTLGKETLCENSFLNSGIPNKFTGNPCIRFHFLAESSLTYPMEPPFNIGERKQSQCSKQTQHIFADISTNENS